MSARMLSIVTRRTFISAGSSAGPAAFFGIGAEEVDHLGAVGQEAVGQQNLRPAMAPEIATTGQPNNGEIEYTATFDRKASKLPEFKLIA